MRLVARSMGRWDRDIELWKGRKTSLKNNSENWNTNMIMRFLCLCTNGKTLRKLLMMSELNRKEETRNKLLSSMNNMLRLLWQKLKDFNKKSSIFLMKIADLEINYNVFIKKMVSLRVDYHSYRLFHKDLDLCKERIKWIK